MREKIRNLGFSLIELIVAFSVLGIATLGMGGFYATSARSYSGTSQQSSLYNEAQLAMNQMEKVIIDAELGVSYCVNTDAGKRFVKSDSEVAASETVKSKVLYIFNIYDEDESQIQLLLIKWDAETKNIYYKEILLSSGTYATVTAIDIESGEWELLAEGVENFSAVLDENGKKVDLSATFTNSKDSYNASKTITLRNSVAVNEDNLDTLFESINVVIQERITGVKIAVSPKIVAPGGSVQLRWEVLGKGDIDQTISQWIVATDSGMNSVIDSSLVSVDGNGLLSVDVSQINNFAGALYIKAKVDTSTTDAEGVVTESYVESGVEKLKVVSNMTVSFTADDNTYTSSLLAPVADENAYPIETGNSLQMSAVVEGDALEDGDKVVTWSIEQTGNAQVSITSDGKLSVDRYSAGGNFYVVAKLAKNDSVVVRYPFTITGAYSQGDSLVVTSVDDIESLNRGAETQYTVTLNDRPINPEDCDWTVNIVNSASGQVITGAPVTVGTTGIVSVKETLSYDYAYTVTVQASLKKDDSVSGTAGFNVPKVELTLTSPKAATTLGSTVKGLVAEVTGLENYTINWSMAKSTSPNYYFTALGNTHITGYVDDLGIHMADLVLGSDEPSALKYITVKAELDGSSTHYKTVNITVPTILISGSDEIVRGGTGNVTATIEGQSNPSVTWTVLGDAAGYVSIDANGNVFVRPDFAWNNKNSDVYVTVRAEWEGLKAEHKIKVPTTTLKLSPAETSIGTGTLEYEYFTVSSSNLNGDIVVKLVDTSFNAISSSDAKIEKLISSYRLSVQKSLAAKSFYVMAYVKVNGTEYTDAYTTSTVNVDQELSVKVANDEVNRGGSVEFTAYRNSNHVIPDDEVTWSITGAEVSYWDWIYQTKDISTSGLSIDSNGTLSIAPDYAWSYKDSSYTVTVEVKASWNGKSATQEVEINSATFTLSPSSSNVTAGKSVTFNANATNIDNFEQILKLELVDAAGIATSSVNGKNITATVDIDTVNGATFKVRASLGDSTSAVATSTVTVGQSISLSAASTTLNRGGSTTLTAKKSDGNTSIDPAAVTWSVDNNPTGVTVTNGVLTIAPDYNWNTSTYTGAAGSITVRATWNGKNTSATQTINITSASASITPTDVTIEAGSSQIFTFATTGIESSAIGGYSWSLSDTTNATVTNNGDGTGTVTVKGSASSSTITVTGGIANTNVTASTSVTTKPSLVVSSSKEKVNRGGSVTLYMKDKNGTEYKVESWKITSVKDASGTSINSTGLSIEGDVLYVSPDFAWSSKGSSISVAIEGTYNGVTVAKETDITVNSATFTVKSNNSTIGTQGSNPSSTTVTVSYTNIDISDSDIKWKATGVNGVSIGSSGKEVQLVSGTNGGTVTVRAYLSETAYQEITVSIVKLDLYATRLGSTYKDGDSISKSGLFVRPYILHCDVNGEEKNVSWSTSGASVSLSDNTYLDDSFVSYSSGTVYFTASYDGVQKTFKLVLK